MLQGVRRNVLEVDAVNRIIERGLDVCNGFALPKDNVPNVKLQLSSPLKMR